MPRIAIVLLLLAGACATRRTVVGFGLAHSTGNVDVSERTSGTGGGVEIAHYWATGRGSFGIAASIDLAGYNSDADGDEMMFAELHGRYRIDLGTSGLFAAFGGSGGYAFPYTHSGTLGAFLELGYTLQLADGFGIDISLRERPALFISDELGVEVHNTLMLGVGLAFGRIR